MFQGTQALTITTRELAEALRVGLGPMPSKLVGAVPSSEHACSDNSFSHLKRTPCCSEEWMSRGERHIVGIEVL